MRPLLGAAAPASIARSASIRSPVGEIDGDDPLRVAAELAGRAGPPPEILNGPVVVPSGSMAGMSTALCSAYTPGGGSGWTWPLSILRRATSRCVGLGEVRSRCASTIAPSAAVISRALVTSNGNT